MSAITNTLKVSKRIIKFVWFIKTYWFRQLIFDVQAFRLYVIEGRSVTVVETPDKLISVNNYHTRYEGTARAAR